MCVKDLRVDWIFGADDDDVDNKQNGNVITKFDIEYLESGDKEKLGRTYPNRVYISNEIQPGILMMKMEINQIMGLLFGINKYNEIQVIISAEPNDYAEWYREESGQSLVKFCNVKRTVFKIIDGGHGVDCGGRGGQYTVFIYNDSVRKGSGVLLSKKFGKGLFIVRQKDFS